MRPLFAAALLVIATTGCSQDANPPLDTVRIRDSADVRIAENPRPPEGSRLGWEIGPAPTVKIGRIDGEDPYLFHRVMNAARLSDGRIVVADAGSNEVRVFDATGTHLASWGGEGEGPGEFHDMHGFARWPGDSVAVWEFGAHEGLSILGAEGNLGRMLSFGTDVSRKEITVLGTPAVLTHTRVRSSDGPGLRVRYQRYEIRNADGEVTASLGTFPAAEFFTFRNQGTLVFLQITFSRSVIAAAWQDLAVVSPNHSYEIRAFDIDGTLRRIVRLDHSPIPATRSLLEMELGEDAGEHLREMPLPETLPAFSTVMSDALGHLWVREYPVPGFETPHPLWMVFDPDGRALGYMETPPGVLIYQIGADYILGRRVGDLGVQSIESWPLLRQS